MVEWINQVGLIEQHQLMASENPICSSCGQPFAEASELDESVCATCAQTPSSNGPTGLRMTATTLLPPRRKGSTPGPSRSNPLLPPQRRSSIAVETKRDRNVGRDGAFVLLPDGMGGFQRVSNRSVRVIEGGTEVQLASRPRIAAMRHRILVNMISIIVGLAVLAVVLWLAINGYL